jgi:hypothetical protein
LFALEVGDLADLAFVRLEEPKAAVAASGMIPGGQEMDYVVRGLQSSPHPMIVLNREQRIVASNRAFRDLCGKDNGDPILGLRFGDAMQCVFACDGQDGCGSSASCKGCSLHQALHFRPQLGKSAPTQALVTVRRDSAKESLLFDIHLVEQRIDDREYRIGTLTEVSDRSRRFSMERILFHDILNTAGNVQSLAELLTLEQEGERVRGFSELMLTTSRQLVDEIHSLRDLIDAEKGDLAVSKQPIDSLETLERLRKQYAFHPVADGQILKIDAASNKSVLFSDQRLVRRIIGNMLKNALEASKPGDVVTMGCRSRDVGVEFWVHNELPIAEENKARIFTRSFSTKGPNRGLGTYSMKLLA